MNTRKHIARLTRLIDRSINEIDPPLNYDRTISALTKLAQLVHDWDEDTDYLWAIEPLADLLTAAYWFCNDHHGGQASPEYACLCALGQVFCAGHGPLPYGPESDSTESDLYDGLVSLMN